MYRTDKQFMKNPATAPSRIYIGGLNKTVIADDLEAKFKVHGNILGLVLNSGFAFIQYETEDDAYSAIKAENNSMMQGRKIIVKQAMDKSRPGQNQGPPQRQGGPPMNKGPTQMGPPPKQNFPSNKPNIPSPQKTPPPPQAAQQTPPKSNPPELKFQPPEREPEFQDENMEDEAPPTIRPPGPPQHNNDNRDRDRKGGGGRPINRMGSGRPNDRDRDRGRFDDRNRFEPPPMDRFNREPYFDDRDRDRERDYPPPGGRPAQFLPSLMDVVPPPPDKNDCEIIVVAKALTEYAEFIELKLKTLGLVVDLLFPNEDVPIGKVLANISSRGCLYAILVMPQNEEHRSLTLNILHGIPQEHRNMPVEDAMILISRNFESYMKGEHIPPESAASMVLIDRHPTAMQMLLNLLAENRQLSTTQYDNLVTYLQERRLLQNEYEIAEGIHPDSDESDSKKAELQSRIMNILNKSTDSPIPTSITAPEPVPAPGPQPILKDPTVQKALDSLLLGDMFKNIAGNA